MTEGGILWKANITSMIRQKARLKEIIPVARDDKTIAQISFNFIEDIPYNGRNSDRRSQACRIAVTL